MNILTTNRLLLRTIKSSDIRIIHDKIFLNLDVVRHTFGKSMFSLDDTKNFIEKNGNFDSKIGLSVLVEKDSDNIIGLAGLLECDYLGEKDFEFGFILAQEFWGKGYATEIGQAQIDFVKNELKRDRVLAIAAPENSSSIKTIKKLGLKLEKSITLNERGNREVYLKQL